MLIDLTKPQTKKLAKAATKITREEIDGELIEKSVTYAEMVQELSYYEWWGQHDPVKNKILISCRAHFSFTVMLAAPDQPVQAEKPRKVVTRAQIAEYVTNMQEEDSDLAWAGNIVKALLTADMREDQLWHVLYGLSEQDGHMKTIFTSLCQLTLNATIE